MRNLRIALCGVVGVFAIIFGVYLKTSRIGPANGTYGIASFKDPYVDAAEGDQWCVSEGLDSTPVSRQGTVILAIKSKCAACTANKDFSERLYEESRSRGMLTYYVLSTKSENDQTAAELKAEGRNVIRGDPRSYGITRVPEVLRLDKENKIVSMWTGTVSPTKEPEVMSALLLGLPLQSYSTIDEELVPEYSRRGNTVVLSLSTSGARHDLPSKVIPASELPIRAQYELEPSRLIVVDCGTVRAARTCQEAVLHLARMQYRVLAAGLPRNSRACRVHS